MRRILQWPLSILFIVQMYLAMLVLGIVFLPWAVVSREGAFAACHAYCRWVMFTARVLVGLKSDVRGTPPADEVLIAAKHQSFFDIIMIFSAVPRGKFIMKRELIWAPVLGLYALRIGCVPVNRGKRAAAITRMMADVKSGAQDPGQLIIYPQGTRVAPGAKRAYKVGTAVLYQQLKQPCVPVATNVGVFWPKRSLYRKPGTAVVEFLPRIEPGLSNDAFMERLETEVETHSNRLMADAGFRVKGAA
ncbi:1-acyl-sn-glycerol-3-phosphate acyltransferase [Aliigemmobacter aestuarii]|uniref:1-acyl-sn-glycerol-3-phosphate acyltransferase n=1 Tax=Aliigemmobacter aestuarii TaxID=1445661 RepID=A0A4S3MNR7_9RHOB|nr:lysophospholipid acyltransferase family protein [Gemmobacter aestuarii]THD83573.1 1-acyl-sn-glycerol-3-phosphate acyltransferase [Gemmobacter aestuarii]